MPQSGVSTPKTLREKASNVFAANWLALPLQFISSVLVVRGAGASGKGVLTLIVTTVTLLGMAGQLSLPAAAIVFLRSGRASARSLFLVYSFVTLLVSIVLAALLALGFGLFRELLIKDVAVGDTLLIIGLGAVPFFMIFSFITTIFLASGDSAAYSALVVGAGLTNVVLTFIAVIVLKLGIGGAVIAATLTHVMAAAAAYGMFLHNTRGEKFVMPRRVGWEFIRFGLIHHGGSLASQMFKRADSYLLAYFLGPAAVGYYSIASMAYEGLLSIPRSLAHLLAGEASALTSAGSAKLVTSASRNVALLMSVVTVVVAALSPVFVPLLFGSDFAVSLPPLFVLLAAAMLFGLTMCIQTYFLSRGRPDLISMFLLTGGAVNLILSMLLIPRAGLVGNAAATAIASALVLLLHVVAFRRSTGLSADRLFIPYKADLTRLRSAARFWKNQAPTPQDGIV